MEGYIAENGRLWIQRRGAYKQQVCPNDSTRHPCGDWCPLFREPQEIGRVVSSLLLVTRH
jgi:hypothetical protein